MDTGEQTAIDTGETYTPYVRYGKYTDYDKEEFEQEHFLPADEDPPEGENYQTIAVYYLEDWQIDWLNQDPTSNYAQKSIQNTCEADGRVRYQIVAESDLLDEDGTTNPEIIEHLTRFIEEWVGAEISEYDFSGSRGPHVHTNYYVTDEGRMDLKDIAEAYNEEFGGQYEDDILDTCLYDKKHLLRLSGVEHEVTGLYKVPIEPDSTREDCIREAITCSTGIESFHPHLPTIDLSHSKRRESKNTINQEPDNTDDRELLPRSGTPTLLKTIRAVETEDVETRDEYDRKRHFSPYAKSGDGHRRSVIVMEQTEEIRLKQEDDDIVAYVPAYIKYAVGGGDGRYISYQSKRLIKLSPSDYAKWTHEIGDTPIIIGGRSGKSRILDASKSEAHEISLALSEDGREDALLQLRGMGYEVGEPGYNGERSEAIGGSRGKTRAEQLKEDIEAGRVDPEREDIRDVCCRLLKIRGFYAAWWWCRDYFGENFNRKDTYYHLKSIVEYWSSSFSEVRVPRSVDAIEEHPGAMVEDEEETESDETDNSDEQEEQEGQEEEDWSSWNESDDPETPEQDDADVPDADTDTSDEVYEGWGTMSVEEIKDEYGEVESESGEVESEADEADFPEQEVTERERLQYELEDMPPRVARRRIRERG